MGIEFKVRLALGRHHKALLRSAADHFLTGDLYFVADAIDHQGAVIGVAHMQAQTQILTRQVTFDERDIGH